MKSNKIIVSVCCLAYNHESYIRKCLEGFLIQKTDFPFEILIHDDASTDGTEEIIREYEAKYPNIIKPLYEKENQWQKGRRGSAIFNFPRARGKYIALCEGDDYWTDPYKLQKQVDFLEANEDYGLVHTDFDIYNVQTNFYTKNAIAMQKPKKKWQEGAEFVKWYVGGYAKIITCTVCFRKSVFDKHYKKEDMERIKIFGDIVLFCTLGANSKVKYFNESTAIKNNLPESASQSQDYKQKFEISKQIAIAFVYYGQKYGVKAKYYKKYGRKTLKILAKYAIFNRDYSLLKSLQYDKELDVLWFEKMIFKILYFIYIPLIKPFRIIYKKVKHGKF